MMSRVEKELGFEDLPLGDGRDGTVITSTQSIFESLLTDLMGRYTLQWTYHSDHGFLRGLFRPFEPGCPLTPADTSGSPLSNDRIAELLGGGSAEFPDAVPHDRFVLDIQAIKKTLQVLDILAKGATIHICADPAPDGTASLQLYVRVPLENIPTDLSSLQERLQCIRMKQSVIAWADTLRAPLAAIAAHLTNGKLLLNDWGEALAGFEPVRVVPPGPIAADLVGIDIRSPSSFTAAALVDALVERGVAAELRGEPGDIYSARISNVETASFKAMLVQWIRTRGEVLPAARLDDRELELPLGTGEWLSALRPSMSAIADQLLRGRRATDDAISQIFVAISEATRPVIHTDSPTTAQELAEKFDALGIAALATPSDAQEPSVLISDITGEAFQRLMVAWIDQQGRIVPSDEDSRLAGAWAGSQPDGDLAYEVGFPLVYDPSKTAIEAEEAVIEKLKELRELDPQKRAMTVTRIQLSHISELSESETAVLFERLKDRGILVLNPDSGLYYSTAR